MEKARDTAIAVIDKEGLVAAEETARGMLGVAVDAVRD